MRLPSDVLILLKIQVRRWKSWMISIQWSRSATYSQYDEKQNYLPVPPACSFWYCSRTRKSRSTRRMPDRTAVQRTLHLKDSTRSLPSSKCKNSFGPSRGQDAVSSNFSLVEEVRRDSSEDGSDRKVETEKQRVGNIKRFVFC